MSEARDYTNDSETLDNCDVEAAYARWAPIYDLTFTTILKPGRRALVAAASKIDGPILDVGVGTGLELPMFEPHTQIYGVDLSEHMLRRAAQRVERDGLRHVVGLYKMDATRMGFADGAFACAVAPYVLTVVPEPEAMLDELARVIRPGGEIILVNHISRKDDPLAILETWLDRHVAPRLGWRPQFPWSIIGDWIDQRADMQLVERRLLPPFGLFSLVRIKRLPQDMTARPQEAPSELEFA
ncbi:phosphatidylethanolamine/phosphatidyl-N-methylethanolamine N-methyltransferase [freshwater sediment metagenome]|jgi:phosphatidylethanolamine/phosphatidyl-N-methylethanolamine N-methyltransferase|uniref:Phosphatidylethanolamine/phosphatidyl-N-methylethanolamine N-methyltransferase n=1 Tax=freshwater sediment metagenome TaxID=556182 RepID=A0AA48M2C3_9ZZZZ